MPFLADDDMVIEQDAERLCDLRHLLRHLDVGMRGRGVTDVRPFMRTS